MTTPADDDPAPSSPTAIGKSSVAPPQTSDGVEMKNLGDGSGKSSLPVEEDIMQIARIGDVAAMQRLFETKKYTAKYADEEGITPLHWAAINNQYAMCRFLLDSGADVNAKGGESVATPAMWAAQRCHYYIVDLLLQRGADPLLTDAQGYNILHLATIDGNAFLLILLLHQGIPVDVTDPQGHTGLMWAAYKGFPVCVDLFLRWGANVNAVDEGGLTPLHWALVKGSHPCVQKILEYGADRFAKTRDGKTPFTVAQDMRSTRVWYRALNDCGYDKDGNLKTLPLGLTMFLHDKNLLAKFYFLWPFLTIFLAIWVLSHLAVYFAIPLALIVIIAMQWIAQRLASGGPAEYRTLQRTPYLAGVFSGTLFWVGLTYLFRILPVTWPSHVIQNVLFIALFAATTYFYALSVMENPGYVPKLGSRHQQREVIRELFDNWIFDEEHFCIHCMLRKPLRSRHCRRCGRCVAKHDHHCPWIVNCVGVNNLRHFYLYIISLKIGILLLIKLVIDYIKILPTPEDTSCNFVNDSICGVVKKDTWTLVLVGWTSLQLIWVTMLCAVQSVQIARNQTTYENMRGHMSLDHPHGASRAITSALVSGTTSAEAAGLTASGQGPNPTVPSATRHPRSRGGFFAAWKKLLGLDTFVATATRPRRGKNPFSRGAVTNCRDFWCDPSPVLKKREDGKALLDGEVVDYYHMYETPLRMRATPGGAGYTSVASEDPEQGT
ncbi:hypothetical protein VTN31DRAFT_2746 [Thermomyces dupontii]|uniref:uncharacterized protein n=1 Tax=Talaromyces thermophilus TaxID=28565 RepID=UPI00374203C4